MYEQDIAIIKGLVAVAWADGDFANSEKQALDGLLAAFGASDEEALVLRNYAETPRTLKDIPIGDLSMDDRRMLLSHAVLLSWVDGHQADNEKHILEQLASLLQVPEDEYKAIAQASTERAKRYLKLLD